MNSPWQLRLDMRRAPTSPTSRVDLYKSALEMCAYADKNGCSNVIISEHHGSADGYLPSALTMAAAIAAVTERTRLSISALVLPLLEPVHTAEETLVVDQISGGRVDVIVGLGYVRSELAMFGLEDHNRVALLEEKLPIYLHALAGEPFAIGGKTILVTPGPVQKPRPQVLLAATVPAAARRAARFGRWRSLHCAARAVGARLPGRTGTARAQSGNDRGGEGSSASLFVSDDPERTWSVLAPYLLHEVNSYGKWAQDNGANEHLYQPTGDLKVVCEMGMYVVMRPEHAQRFVTAAGNGGGNAAAPCWGVASRDRLGNAGTFRQGSPAENTKFDSRRNGEVRLKGRFWDVCPIQMKSATVRNFGGSLIDMRRAPTGVIALGSLQASLSTALSWWAVGAEIKGREAIGNVLEHLETNYVRTMHFVGNHVVDFVGDEAQGETYCIAHHIYSDNAGERDTSMFIRYNDSYTRTSKGWKMSRRELNIAWQEDRPVIG